MNEDSKSRRKYIRLNSCFPVEFSLYFIESRPFSKEYQAYTQDVSSGGLCIRVKDLEKKDLDTVLAKESKLKLFINLPIRKNTSSAEAEIVWAQKDEDDPTGRTYKIGLSYLNIDECNKKRIFNHARRLKWFPRIKIFVIIFLLLSCSFLYIENLRERTRNRDLVSELVSV
ncbi:MAG: PilZ domain-containing protein [Candidatus Omnitrophota bacterium]